VLRMSRLAPAYPAESPEEVLKELVQRSLGELERAVLATPDGVVLAVSSSSDYDDMLAALSAAVVAGVGDAFRQHLLLGVRHVTIELEDGRVAIMRDLGSAVLCLVTRPKPNLGLIYHLLGKHESGLLAALDRYYARAAEPAPIERAQAAAPRAAYRVKG